MSDSLSHDRLSDDHLRNRIAAALRELDQPESDADIAAALDAIDAEPLGDAAMQHIMQQVQRSIAETSASPRSLTLRAEKLGSESSRSRETSDVAGETELSRVRLRNASLGSERQATGRRLSQLAVVAACAA